MEEKGIAKTIFKSITEALPFIVVNILLMGLFGQTLYYQSFKIPIQNFIGLSEISLLFSTEIIFTSIGVLFGLFTLQLNIRWVLKTASRYSDKPETYTQNLLKAGLKNSYVFYLVIAGITFVFLMLIESYVIKSLLLALFIILFSLGISGLNFETIQKTIDKSNVLVILLLIMMYAGVFFNTGLSIEVVNSGKYKGTVIKTTDTTYISNDTTYFIGKTEKWVFIYESKKKGSKIIPIEKVEEMFITSK